MTDSVKHDRALVVSTTTGTGTYTLGAAVTGYQTLRAGDDGKQVSYSAWDVDGSGVPSGGFETGIGTYTASGTTLARTAIRESSASDAAVSWAAGTRRIAISPLASFDLSFAAAPNANTTMVVGQMYVADMSAWATADRAFTLPAAPAIGDRTGVLVAAGNASFELIIVGNTGQTINGGAAATEWSRLFITGESVTLRCVGATAWVVEIDRRIPQSCLLRLSTAAAGETGGVFTAPTAAGGAWTADINIGGMAAIATSKIIPRRAGNYRLAASTIAATNITVGQYFGARISKGGAEIIGLTIYPPSALQLKTPFAAFPVPLATDDNLLFEYRSQEGSRGVLNSSSPTLNTFFGVVESF